MPEAVIITVEAVLFDLDGVLVDSTAAVESVWRNFAHRHELDADLLLADLHGRRMVDIVRRALPDLGDSALQKEIDRIEKAEAEGATATRALPGAVDLVTSLDGVPWAIVTSGTSPVALGRIAAVGFPQPTVLVTGEQVDEGKPSPVPYLQAAAALGVAPSGCMVVEDAPSGVRAGLAAGATTVAVTTSHTAEQVAHAAYVVASAASITRVGPSGDRGDGVTLRLQTCRR